MASELQKGYILYREEAIIANPITFDAPATTAVRAVPSKKINRLRVSWFILGTAFGMCCAFLLGHFFASPASDTETPASISKTDTPHTAQIAADKTSATATQEAPVTDPTHFILQVNKGDTLSVLLTRKGVKPQEAHHIITALRKEYDPRRLTVGQKLELQLNENKLSSAEADFDVAALRIRLSPVETVELIQENKGEFRVSNIQAALTTQLDSGGGVINSSLYQTGVEAGIPPAIIATLINAYSYDVDFQRDIKRGDQFNVVFERMVTDENVSAGYGRMLYASIVLGGQEKRIYHYTRDSGETGYYDETGQSVRKALLRTPINGARLSSGYGMRHHPILGYGRMHKGVDFAAPTGTPIYAAGDGMVDYSGRRGAYGNYVRIRHNNQYSTAYAHMSRIAQKARKGQRVKQGDVIGYVGTTGRSTGPHLHYEVLKNGEQVNPRNIKFPTGHKLAGQELASFKRNIQEINMVASRLLSNEQEVARASTGENP